MDEVEEIQEKMKADMEAIKKKMATMMEAMMSVKKILNFFFFFFNFRRNFQEIGKDSKRFLWGFEDGIEKISWVGCEKICCPKEDGRLGVKDISLARR